MPRTLELLGRGPITIESAIDEEKNVINWFEHSQATEKLYNDVWERRRSIEALVRHHLGLRGYSTCVVQPRDSWLRGTFNLCVLVEVHTRRTREKIIFRCPMPHKLAETKYPGSVDEKLRCEVATSIWVGEHCPEIRPPHLFGFGLPGHRHVRIVLVIPIGKCLADLLLSLLIPTTCLSTTAFSGISNDSSTVSFVPPCSLTT